MLAPSNNSFQYCLLNFIIHFSGAALEEHLILDNRYTEHSTVGLAQQWDQLDQLSMRMQHNLEQQIQARNHSGQ